MQLQTTTQPQGQAVSRTRVLKWTEGKVEELIQKPVAILLDVSGSMRQTVGRTEKIDILRVVMKGKDMKNVYAFSGLCQKISYIPDPHGSTNLINALDTVDSQHIIMISDGIADDSSESIEHAVRLKKQIDVLYIGEGGDAGEQFMKTLSERTGGKWLTIDIMKNTASEMELKLGNGLNALLLGA
jgi:hypothetical protein